MSREDRRTTATTVTLPAAVHPAPVPFRLTDEQVQRVAALLSLPAGRSRGKVRP